MTTEVLDRPEVAAKETATALALRQVNAHVAEFDAVEAGLQDLEKRFANVVYDCATTKGMTEAKAARQEIRDPRYAVQNAADAAKKPLTALSKAIGARKEEICARILAIETPIDEQIKAEEDRKALEKAAREQAEREAAAAVQRRIDAIREMVAAAVGNPAWKIEAITAELSAIEITLEDFGDLAGAAMQAKSQTVAKLEEMAAAAHAAEQAAIEAAAKAEADRIERERIAAEQKAEADRLAAERKALEEQQAAMRAEQAKADREAAAARAKADREAAAARAEADRIAAADRAAAQKILDDQAAELRAQREAQEARERAAREEQEAKDRAARQALEDQERAARAEAQAKADAEAAAIAKAARELKEAEEAAADAERARKRAEEEAEAAAEQRGRNAWRPLLAACRAGFMQTCRDTRPMEWEMQRAAIELATGEQP